MFLTLTFVGMLLVGAFLMSFANRLRRNSFGWLDVATCLIFGIGGAGVLVCGVFIFGANVPDPGYQYQVDCVEYETLEFEDKNGYLTFSEDVVSYNKKVLKYRKWANNPWTNWLYYDGCENLPYYELNKGE